MSLLQQVQAGSIPFKPVSMFSAPQQLGDTTNFAAFPTSLGKPVTQAGSASANPIAVFDNRTLRCTYALIMLGAKAANNANLAFDVTGFSEVQNASATTPATGKYLPIRFFNGVAQAGNINISVLGGTSNVFLCDNFPTKTFAGGNVSYIEPTDDIGGAVLIVDMRGVDFLAVRLAQGGATAATYGQVFIGVN